MPPVVVPLEVEVEVDEDVLVEELVLVLVLVDTGGLHDFVHLVDLLDFVLLLKLVAFASLGATAATDAVAIETPTMAALVILMYCMSNPLPWSQSYENVSDQGKAMRVPNPLFSRKFVAHEG